MSTIQFTPDLSAFQGVIISADHENPFKDLSVKGGNENNINTVITTVKHFLQDKKFINNMGVTKDSEDIMRRFAMYIVVNSDLTVLNELINTDSSIDLLIWTVPTIPKCLMCEMLWNFCMGKYIKEIITFSYPQLAVEVADALITHMKYMDPTACLKHLHILSTACFDMLCRIFFFGCEEILLKSAFGNFQKCMAYFCNPPNENKLEILKKDDLYKYYGNCLYTMLTILSECFIQYNTSQKLDLNNPVTLYEVTYSNKCTNKSEYKPSKCTDKMIAEILNNCLMELLDKSMQLVMGINLDIFCAWSEFEENNVTMQESVGKLSYKVRQELLNSDMCDHPLVSMLEQISRKPINAKDIINETDVSVVIEHIKQNNNDTIQWLLALANRNNLSDDLVLLQIVEANLDKLNENSSYDFFQKLYHHHSVCVENKQFIQILLAKLFQRCNKASKYEIVDTHFNNGCFNNDMECTEFVSMLTEFFNKLAVSSDADVSDLLSIFVQNPRKVYDTILKTSFESAHQTKLMFKLMLYLLKYANHYYSDETEPCLTILLKDVFDNEDVNTVAKQDNLTNFITNLKNADIISTNKLLLLIIMPKLHVSLINKNYKNIHLQCELLHKCYSLEELIEYRTPMLAMLAQVMAQLRWKVNTFDALCPVTLNRAIDLQTSLMYSYNGNIPENEVPWLKRKLKLLDPLNMFYYRQLWNPPGNTFVEVISGIHIHINMDIEMLTLWLSPVLCSSTLQEWIYIWDSLKEFGDARTLDLYHHAMILVLNAEKCNRSDTTWACILYCYKNLFHCIRYKFFKEPLSNSQVSNVINKLLTITSAIREEYTEEFGAVVMPLFAYIAERKADYSINVSQTIKSNLQQSKLQLMIQNLFCNTLS